MLPLEYILFYFKGSNISYRKITRKQSRNIQSYSCCLNIGRQLFWRYESYFSDTIVVMHTVGCSTL